MPGKFDLRSSIEHELRSRLRALSITVSDWLLERWIAGEMWREAFLFGATTEFRNVIRSQDFARRLSDNLWRKIEQYALPHRGIAGSLEIHDSSPWPECFTVGDKLQLALGDYAARGISHALKGWYPAVASDIPGIAADCVRDVCKTLQTELASPSGKRALRVEISRIIRRNVDHQATATVGSLEGVVRFRLRRLMLKKIHVALKRQRRNKTGSEDDNDIAEIKRQVSSTPVFMTEAQYAKVIDSLKQRISGFESSITRDIALRILEGYTFDRICDDSSIADAIIAEAGGAALANRCYVMKSIKIRVGFIRKEFAYRLGFIDLIG